MKSIIAVGLGGGIGAIIRYLISIIPYESKFPFHTFITNILGAIVIGFVIGLIDGEVISLKHHALFWKTGFCGGLTTFSTFSFESLKLIEEEKVFLAIIYISFSVIMCIFGVYLGRYISKLLI